MEIPAASMFRPSYTSPACWDANWRQAQRVGMQTGDVEFASMSANLWGYIAVDTDIPLDDIERQWTSFRATMESHRQKAGIRMSVTCLRTVQYLQGKDVDWTETHAILHIDNHITAATARIRWDEAKTAFLLNDLLRADELAYQCDFSKNVR
jgi:hypothetical protein